VDSATLVIGLLEKEVHVHSGL